MATDFPHCNHGLIVSLKDVAGNLAWQFMQNVDENDYVSIYSWQQESFDAANKADYKPIVSGTDATAPINYIGGYQNTKLLRAYNGSRSGQNVYEKDVVLPVYILNDWKVNNPPPTNTTGWYIPSLKELTLLC